mmetsp:Transcript_21128/g.58625  ORF Transcript_21128/g.58625 Transcript_21128/m.58625 type:complete len:285 (-) Transcript_21128:1903-2757(-)
MSLGDGPRWRRLLHHLGGVIRFEVEVQGCYSLRSLLFSSCSATSTNTASSYSSSRFFSSSCSSLSSCSRRMCVGVCLPLRGASQADALTATSSLLVFFLFLLSLLLLLPLLLLLLLSTVGSLLPRLSLLLLPLLPLRASAAGQGLSVPAAPLSKTSCAAVTSSHRGLGHAQLEVSVGAPLGVLDQVDLACLGDEDECLLVLLYLVHQVGDGLAVAPHLGTAVLLGLRLLAFHYQQVDLRGELLVGEVHQLLQVAAWGRLGKALGSNGAPRCAAKCLVRPRQHLQ